VVRELGADEVVDVRRNDSAQRLRALAPAGLDAALALAGGDALERCLDLVRPGGRVAYPNGVEPEPRRRSRVTVLAYDAIAGRDEFAALEQAADQARLRVVIAGVYPLAQAAAAHARVERGGVIGRVVLKIGDGGF
jgi:NADPH:quinone reductase-like Zn-dependent oxidoreductase